MNDSDQPTKYDFTEISSEPLDSIRTNQQAAEKGAHSEAPSKPRHPKTEPYIPGGRREPQLPIQIL